MFCPNLGSKQFCWKYHVFLRGPNSLARIEGWFIVFSNVFDLLKSLPIFLQNWIAHHVPQILVSCWLQWAASCSIEMLQSGRLQGHDHSSCCSLASNSGGCWGKRDEGSSLWNRQEHNGTDHMLKNQYPEDGWNHFSSNQTFSSTIKLHNSTHFEVWQDAFQLTKGSKILPTL